MSLTFKINHYGNMTYSEKRLSQFIMENQHDVLQDSAQMLSDKAGVSPATIIRFAKNLGYKGFPELKLALMADITAAEQTLETVIENIEEADSIQEVIAKTQRTDLRTVEQTYQLLSDVQLEYAVNAIKSANKIILFGVGGSSIPCYDLCQKLLRVEKNAMYLTDMQLALSYCTSMCPNDVAIFISYSGHTKELVRAAKMLKSRNIPLIVITQSIKSPLQKLGDCVLFIPTQENDLRLGALSSRNASLMLTDLLYLGLIKDDLTEVKSRLLEANSLVKTYSR